MIKVICFDLDDTLWPAAPVLRHAEATLYDYLQSNHPALTARFSPENMRELGKRVLAEQPELADDVTNLRKALLHLAARESGESEALVEPAFAVFLQARNEVTFYPEVLNVMRTLHGQYTLGALSNGNANVARTDLKDYFDFALSPAGSVAPKPHPDAFRAVLQTTGIRREQLLHVGDDPETDIRGATEAGIRAVWVNRERRPWPQADFPHIRPNHEIATLSALPEFLSTAESDGC